jgi:crotonobetainyl-CoA:carnitine CoA-transferase CaiB-like acyl-CoA transferase
MPLPLHGVRVLDLTRVLAGPLCTMILGDLGAEVIKVERPGRGDDTREWGPPFDDRGESAYYLSINRNKISVAVDLSSPEGRKTILDLANTAQVVVDNFLPGTLEAFHIDVDEILRLNSRLIWCTITGFGATSRRPGYDFVIQAETGWMAMTGDPQGDPVKVGVAVADILTGKDAAIAILAALAAPGRDSSERRIGVSLAESARAALVNVAQNTLVTGEDAKRWGNAHANLVPYQLFSARDRQIVIAVGTDEHWRACVGVLGLRDLEVDRELASNRGRLARRKDIVTAFERVLQTRTAGEWVRMLESAGVPCGVVKSVLEVIEDTKTASALTGMPSSVGGRIRYPPPSLDEQGDLVRRRGWDAFQLLPP